MRRSELSLMAICLVASVAIAAEKPAQRAKPAERRANPCASYGEGFAMLPGTTTCMRVGGAVVGDFSSGSPAANTGAR